MTSSAPAPRASCAFSPPEVVGDDASAAQLDDLGEKQADAAGRGVDEDGVARLHRIGVEREVMRGHALQQDGAGQLPATPSGTGTALSASTTAR